MLSPMRPTGVRVSASIFSASNRRRSCSRSMADRPQAARQQHGPVRDPDAGGGLLDGHAAEGPHTGLEVVFQPGLQEAGAGGGGEGGWHETKRYHLAAGVGGQPGPSRARMRV